MSAHETSGRRTLAGWRMVAGIAVLFLAGLGVGAVFAARGADSEDTAASSETADARAMFTVAQRRPGTSSAPAQSALPISEARRTPIVVAAQRVGPSVVSIRVTRTVQTPASIFDRFFGEGGRTRTVPNLGSGFAIDGRGTILTNHHVVRGAESIEVIDAQGQRFAGELVGSDDLTDLAVVRIPTGRVPAAPLGTSSGLFVGEPAIAIGNPSGFALQNTEATVTSGIVSGVGRDIQSPDREVLYADMIQTDASINPGNSGGPLVNAEGEVIGVNSSIFSYSGGSEGLGFAIPIDRALRIAGELVEFGRVRRPWVGLDVITDRSDSVFSFTVVERVHEGTPAAQSGLRRGDRIVSLDARPVHHDLDWQVGLVEAGVGSTVDVTYRRGDGLRETRLRLEEIPSGRAERVEVLSGLGLVTVTPQIVQERGLAIEFGALIVSIDESVERVTGLRRGDVIWGINNNEVRTAQEAGELFTYYARGGESRGWVRVHVARGTRRLRSDFRVG